MKIKAWPALGSVCFFVLILNADSATLSLTPDSNVSDAIRRADIGDTVELLSGIYHQNIVIDRALVLWASVPGTVILDGGFEAPLAVVRNGDFWQGTLPYEPTHIMIGSRSIFHVGADNIRARAIADRYTFNDGDLNIWTSYPEAADTLWVHPARQDASVGISIEADGVFISGLIVRGFPDFGIRGIAASRCRVSQCAVIGCRVGISFGSDNGMVEADTVDCCDVGNPPLYLSPGETRAYCSPCGSDFPSPYFYSDGSGGIAFRRCMGALVRSCFVYDQLDGIRFQQQRGSPETPEARNVAIDNLVQNCHDDGIEIESWNRASYNASQVDHNVFLDNFVGIALSPLVYGSSEIVNNLLLHSYPAGLDHAAFFKWDSQSRNPKTGIMEGHHDQNISIVHNTARARVGAPDKTRFRLCWGPAGSFINCTASGNIFSVPREQYLPFGDTGSNIYLFDNLGSAVFAPDSAGHWSLTPASDGVPAPVDGENYRGAINPGEAWHMNKVGVSWMAENFRDVVLRPEVPGSIRPEDIGR